MEEIRDKKLFKITNEKECHHGFQYQDGLNILTEPFAETGSCAKGGFYFTDVNNIFKFLDFGIYLREITLPFNDPDFKVVKDLEGDKWRTNKIIFGKRYNLDDVETFKYLISMGANIKADNDYAVKWASKKGHLEVIKYLVSLGADIRADNDEAVRWASYYGHLEVVKYLVSMGADIKANNETVRLASYYGHLKMVKYLVSMGADISAENDYVVRWAAEKGHLEVVKYLVSMGADIRAKNDQAVRWASRNGHLEMVKYLVSLGAKLKE